MSVQEIESAIARLPPTDVAEIARWIAQFQPGSGDRVAHDTAGIEARLRDLVQEAEVGRWLDAPNARLSGASPREAIARGQTAQVDELLAAVEEGIYV